MSHHEVEDGRWTACFEASGLQARVRHLPYEDALWGYVRLDRGHPCYGLPADRLPRLLGPLSAVVEWSKPYPPGGADPAHGHGWFIGSQYPSRLRSLSAERHCRELTEALAAGLARVARGVRL